MLQLDDPKIENIIKITFDSEIQHKRVRKELQGIASLHQKTYKTSVQPTQLGLKILIELQNESLSEMIKDPMNLTFPVVFEIYLDKKFPFVSPRLYCKSDFFKPSFADGRDFLDDVVEQQWTPAILLKDVLVMLIKFIKKINKIASPEEASDLGKYYIDKVYDFDDFLVMNSVGVFPAQEVINDQGKTEERYIIVSDSYFLNFAIQDKKSNGATLLFYSKIKSIANIKKNKENPKTLVFTFHDKSKKSGVTQSMFILDDASKLIELVIDVGQKYGMKINRTVNKPQDLTLAEVTAKSYENIDIEELLEDITVFESRLENDISVDVINILMALYQKTIEYFSAFNDPAYADFVDRLHSLLKRKDVQVILQSQEEHNPSASSSKTRKERKGEDEEEEKKDASSFPQNRYEDEENLQPNVENQQNQKISLKEGSKGSHDNEKPQLVEDFGNENVGIDLGEHSIS